MTPSATGCGSWASTRDSLPGSRERHPDRSSVPQARRPRSFVSPRAQDGRWRVTPGTSRIPSRARGCATRCSPGRTLAEQVLPALDDPAAVDRATRRWEAARDRECLPAYHFANADTRVERPSPTLGELVRDAGRTTDAGSQRPVRPGSHAAADRAAGSPRARVRSWRCPGASDRARKPRLARFRTCAPSSRSDSSCRAGRFRSSATGTRLRARRYGVAANTVGVRVARPRGPLVAGRGSRRPSAPRRDEVPR